MTIKYVGNRAFEARLAEFAYTEKEEKKAEMIIELLKDRGYKVDDGVYGWAAIKVEDREEYEDVKNDYKEIKKKVT